MDSPLLTRGDSYERGVVHRRVDQVVDQLPGGLATGPREAKAEKHRLLGANDMVTGALSGHCPERINGEGGEVVAGRRADGAHDPEGHPKSGSPAIQGSGVNRGGDAQDKLRGGVSYVRDNESLTKTGGGGVDVARERPLEWGEIHDHGH